MKVLKPLSLSLLTRPFEVRRRFHLGVSIFAFVPLRGALRLHTEQELWNLVPRVLGSQPVLDQGIPKSRAELLVVGRAFPPSRPDTTCPVEVRLGDVEKSVHVVGDRFWERGVPTEPEPFEAMDIGWRNAFGGEGFADNPVGKGVAPIEVGGRTVHPLPNVEQPNELIRAMGERPKPAGLGPIDFDWPQRARHRGTYDRAWLETRYPGFADDLDWRMWNVAPEDQQRDGFFSGDEAYRVTNMHPDEPTLQGTLPGLRARCFVVLGEPGAVDNERRPGGELSEVETRLSTVWMFPEHERAVLVFSGSCEIGEDDARDVKLLLAAAERVGQPRPLEHYDAVVSKRFDKDRAAIEALVDEDLVPAELVGKLRLEHPELASDGRLQRNLRRRAEREYADAQAKLEELSMTPEEIGLEPPELDPEPPTLRELPDKLEQMRRDLAAQEEQAKRDKEQLVERVRRMCDEAGYDFEQMRGSLETEHTGPPGFRADEQRALARRLADQAAAAGAPVAELEHQATDEQIYETWKRQEVQLLDVYRRSAHLQRAAPRMDARSAEQAREEVLEAVAAGRSLQGRDLTGIDLSGCDLRGAKLAGAFLESARLVEATLDGADLTAAVLAHGDLTGASLRGARMRGCNLGGARLAEASTDARTDLREATLMGADADDAKLIGADLTGAVLIRARFSRADFSEAILDGVAFFESPLLDARFCHARLTKANFVDVDLSRADFADAVAPEANFLKSRLDGARFVRADLTKARLVHHCSCPRADFRHASMAGANLRGLDLSESDLSGCQLDGADLSEANLHRANLYRVVARHALMIRTDLSQAQLMGSNLMGSLLTKADIRHADMRGANLYGTDFARVRGDATTLLDGADQTRARIHPRRDA